MTKKMEIENGKLETIDESKCQAKMPMNFKSKKPSQI